MGALLALLWTVDGVGPLMVRVPGFRFLSSPLPRILPPYPTPALPTQPPLCFLVVIFSVLGEVFWSYCMTYGISVPQLGIKPEPQEAES